ASRLRARIRRLGEATAEVTAVDPAGQLVMHVESLTLRAPSVPQARVASQDALLTLDWLPLAEIDTAATDPAGYVVLGRDAGGIGASVTSPAELTGAETAVLLPVSDLRGEAGDEQTPQTVHATTARALELIQHWLTDDRLVGVPLILLTRDAVTGGDLAG